MCLVVAAWRTHPRFRLILAGNRDEFHARPAAPADWWPDLPGLVAGRDLEAGGTWLGVHRDGRFGVVTNYREGSARAGEESRGRLLTDFFAPDTQADEFARSLTIRDQRYAGFNLLFGDRERFLYHTNRDATNRALDAGIYGVSNAQLDTPWPKLERTRKRFAAVVSGDDDPTPETLLEMLADRQPAGPDGGLSDLDPSLAQALSAPFILTPSYGTRCSTVVLMGERGKVEFVERRFDAKGAASGETRLTFSLL